ncbi:UDP-glucuronosyltransferase 2B17-like isoform X2 [Biomphalaria glabrata]|uniref:UDP-glucuronosyltransferase 2B17-like isoform X2 n=1 Tax=Biomphalaria glabrata TaxID=6526 RepID=A0A9W2YYP3_BIOGL|nr:UDP-glucuronosyltransferase 2B17-like isoform X2 [Biomphalaria glabrata]
MVFDSLVSFAKFLLFCSVLGLLLFSPKMYEAKKVVMFPSTTRSYILYHSNIAQSLMNLGHDVWLCVPRYLADENLVSNRSIRLLTYDSLSSNDTLTLEEFWQVGNDSIFSLFRRDLKKERYVRKTLADTEFLGQLQSIKPDLFVLELSKKIVNLVVIPYKYSIPFAFVGTMNDPTLTRTYINPSFEPIIYLNLTDNMTFLQRLKSSFLYYYYFLYHPYIDNSVVPVFAPEKERLTINEIVLKAEIFLFEADNVMDYPRVSLPNIKFIGSSSAKPAKRLTGDLKMFADNSTNGIALVSFGSKNLLIPRDILDKMATSFREINLNVIWRIKQISINSSKIITREWFPQNDLLGHPNMKVFISHCGKNGQYEALYHAVPMLCIPLQTDQFYNAERVTVKRFGLSADIRAVSSEQLTNLIQEVATNPKYKVSIQKSSNIYKHLYASSSIEAAFWLDHVMTYGSDHMRSQAQKVPLYQFLNLDILVFAFIICAIAPIILTVLCYKLFFILKKLYIHIFMFLYFITKQIYVYTLMDIIQPYKSKNE